MTFADTSTPSKKRVLKLACMQGAAAHWVEPSIQGQSLPLARKNAAGAASRERCAVVFGGSGVSEQVISFWKGGLCLPVDE